MNNEEILTRFLVELERVQKKSKYTITSYRWNFTPFLQFLAKKDLPLGMVKYPTFVDYLISRTWHERTIFKFAGQCRKFIRWCKNMEIPIHEFVPQGEFKTPKVVRGRPKCITREELLRLLDQVKGHRMEIAVGLAGLAALRRAEIMIVRHRDADLTKNMLRVDAPKTKKTRYVPISPRLRDILIRHRPMDAKPDDPILNFPHFGGTSGNGLRSLHAACAKAKITRCGWHALRHTAATLMVKSNASLENVRSVLGHSNLSQTSIYTWPDDEGMAAAVASIL